MGCFRTSGKWRSYRFWVCLGLIAASLGYTGELCGQTVSTGAVTGVTFDPSGAALPRVIVRLSKEEDGETKTATSDDAGRFGFLLMPPGTYKISAQKTDFEPLTLPAIHVTVTETLRVELRLQLATRHERAESVSNALMVDIDSSALGRDVSQNAVSGLPLVTRNFTQIAGLSPGVIVGVINAGELGLGGTALSQIAKSNDGIYVHGARSYDNNFELDGITVSDVQGSGSGSGGIPIPNPDTIEEFKVQTGLSDAAFGRYAGANISVITKTGSNEYHGTVFKPLVLRGGYGTYYSRTTGQAFYQSVFGIPFSLFRLNGGLANANATFQAPFPQPFPTPDSFPLFPAYSPTTTTTIYSVAPGFRPALSQQFSLNLQAEIHPGWLLEGGYVGTRGTHLMRQRSLNQALSASLSNPIRGQTSDTIANIGERVPIPGVPPDSLVIMESEGRSWYNALELSLTKRLSHGLEFLASYTFSKTMDTDGADINSNSSGNGLTLGDQNSPNQRWGRASFDRTHRLVFSLTWTLPSPSTGIRHAVLGGWDLATVITIQSGSALTIANTNANNVFGISEDRAEMSGRCAKNQLVTTGPIGSKLNSYFNASCFTTLPVIGADGIGTAFGNSGTGIVDGPGQANLDLSVSKAVGLAWPHENSTLQLRAEFFNVFNHPQFANPDTNFSSPTFGVITSTAVNARVGQLALRWSL